jgi:hypothetical protein
LLARILVCAFAHLIALIAQFHFFQFLARFLQCRLGFFKLGLEFER